MIVSMTGYGSASEVFQTERGRLEITFDIKTLNSRYIDLSIRSPKAYISFDSDISKLVRKSIRRGRVEVTYSVRMLDGQAEEISINHSMIKKLASELEGVRKELGLSTPVQMADLLKFPEWLDIKESRVSAHQDWEMVEKVGTKAMQVLMETRQKEGASLESIIRNHLKQFKELFNEITAASQNVLLQFRGRWKEKVKNLLEVEKIDPLRLEQEIGLWVARSDFQEELDRISQHLVTFEDILKKDGEICRKLEFLVQEIHREVNTLGSKCPDAQLTSKVIELKAVIERIREQLQNGE